MQSRFNNESRARQGTEPQLQAVPALRAFPARGVQERGRVLGREGARLLVRRVAARLRAAQELGALLRAELRAPELLRAAQDRSRALWLSQCRARVKAKA